MAFRISARKLEGKLAKLNDVVTWLREETERVRQEYDATTDKWKETDRAQSVESWISSLDSAMVDIENGMNELEQLEAPES